VEDQIGRRGEHPVADGALTRPGFARIADHEHGEGRARIVGAKRAHGERDTVPGRHVLVARAGGEAVGLDRAADPGLAGDRASDAADRRERQRALGGDVGSPDDRDRVCGEELEVRPAGERRTARSAGDEEGEDRRRPPPDARDGTRRIRWRRIVHSGENLSAGGYGRPSDA